MAANAYVLLTVEPQLTDEVAARLEAIPRALVRQVLGPYDMIVELSEDTGGGRHRRSENRRFARYRGLPRR